MNESIPVVGPTFYPDTEYTLRFKHADKNGQGVYDLIRNPGLIQGEVKIPQQQIERLIEINEDYATADRLAFTLRDPSKGMHAQPVENGKCWNVRLVINP